MTTDHAALRAECEKAIEEDGLWVNWIQTGGPDKLIERQLDFAPTAARELLAALDREDLAARRLKLAMEALEALHDEDRNRESCRACIALAGIAALK